MSWHAPPPPEHEATAPDAATQAGPPKDFKAFLLSMPDVGDDSIFERPLDDGREVDLCEP